MSIKLPWKSWILRRYVVDVVAVARRSYRTEEKRGKYSTLYLPYHYLKRKPRVLLILNPFVADTIPDVPKSMASSKMLSDLSFHIIYFK